MNSYQEENQKLKQQLEEKKEFNRHLKEELCNQEEKISAAEDYIKELEEVVELLGTKMGATKEMNKWLNEMKWISKGFGKKKVSS